MEVVVVIPFYKDNLTGLEKIALEQIGKVLSGYPIIAIKPASLVLTGHAATFPFTSVINFDDNYFKDVQGYNALMLSDVFYKEFLAYEFMLIHQLDAFVFSDKLSYWCNQGYDYIGAPWIRVAEYPDFIKAVKSKIQFYYHARFDVQKHGFPSPMQYEFKVGNGGFSLRRVKKFHDLSISLRHKMDKYLTRTEHEFNEDIFWAIEVNRKRKILKIPAYRKALKFAIELAPAKSLKLNNNEIPFGCHAWDKHLDFWRPIFKNYGYDI
ncbi:DUF5672 family protein [Mucilaginibacter sp. AW1-7]|jgi:hypothetical protein|uniref:DUF5672 family protein n=1 Tax=unclassified Mucilaginibacter TaxID=2617802 RepID=UPI0008ADC0D3|nr:DUF5672 family protein [Mucilaginibacter sp. OK283]SEO24137.1 hypothetical protein SAMN05428947_101851 [Mucilaginibacter sp. OK283]